jgi:autoinducer 2-degrading protein
MYSVFVTIDVKSECLSEFTQASLADARGSVGNESGCFRFDILRDNNLDSRFYLYEVYRDEEALQEHLQTPHFKLWHSTVENMVIGDINSVKMNTVFPSGSVWEKQKKLP